MCHDDTGIPTGQTGAKSGWDAAAAWSLTSKYLVLTGPGFEANTPVSVAHDLSQQTDHENQCWPKVMCHISNNIFLCLINNIRKKHSKTWTSSRMIHSNGWFLNTYHIFLSIIYLSRSSSDAFWLSSGAISPRSNVARADHYHLGTTPLNTQCKDWIRQIIFR